MASVSDIARVLHDSDSTRLIVLSGKGASGKSFLTQAIQDYYWRFVDKQHHTLEVYSDGEFYPSASYDGPCRILETNYERPMIDSTFPWIRTICFIGVDKEIMGTFETPQKLTDALEVEMQKYEAW